MSEHTIKCRETGEALANKLDGGTCVCKPGECEMRKLRNREGDYAKNNSEDEGFDAIGFAIGLATGFPVGPRGITMGAIVGSLLHPTERHAAYDVTGPAADAQPATPPAPVRDPDWNDNSTKAAPVDQPAPEPVEPAAPARDIDPPTRDPDPSPAPVDSGYTPPAEPSYSAPDPTPADSGYTPDPSPSYDSGSSGGSSGGTDP